MDGELQPLVKAGFMALCERIVTLPPSIAKLRRTEAKVRPMQDIPRIELMKEPRLSSSLKRKNLGTGHDDHAHDAKRRSPSVGLNAVPQMSVANGESDVRDCAVYNGRLNVKEGGLEIDIVRSAISE